MSGDLPFDEILVLHTAGTGAGGPAASSAGSPGPVVGVSSPRGHLLARFGPRVEIRLPGPATAGGAAGAAPAAPVVPDVPAELLEELTETERFGVEAMRLRSTSEYAQRKQQRPRQGHRWDMPGCAGAPAPAGLLQIGRAPTPGGAGAQAPAGGTSDWLTGSVACGVVIVNGPTDATRFSAAEQTKVVAEVQAGASWLAGWNRWAGVSFDFDIRVVDITTQPGAAATDNEARWRNPAVAALGFAASWSGVSDYVRALRTGRRTNWAYCVFFVKGYPLDHFAYASIGGPRIVMDYANDGWGPDNIDRVFAHETGHIFGAPDEYASSGCDCGGSWGRWGAPNTNCENCAGASGVSCLMRANEWAMCSPTTRHFGWGLTSLRTRQPAAVHAVSRSQDKLDVFVTDAGGGTMTAAWEPAMRSWWEGWWGLLGGRAAPGAHVTAVSRRPDHLDVFVVGTDGRAYTAAWAPGSGWRGWWRIGTAQFPPGSMISAVSRSTDHLDVFATDTAGRVLTAAWEPAFTDGWHGWWHLRGGRARPGAPVTSVSRSRDKLDVFVTGTDGRAYTAAWEPTFTDWWHGWWRIRDASFPQGAPITVVSRAPDKLDVFGTDTAGRTMTAAWEPAFTDGWHGWWHIRGGRAAAGAPVTAVSRSRDKLDVFVVGTDQVTYTAAWEPAFSDGWHGWWNLNGGRAAHGSWITAVSRRPDFLDVWVVGLDGRPYSAAWSPGRPWAGWWPMGT